MSVDESTELLPIDEPQFLFLFELGSAAMDGRVPPEFVTKLAGTSFAIEIAPGHVEQVAFKDHPVVRLVEAVSAQVPDPHHRLSATGRIFHLYALLDKPQMQKWVRVSRVGSVVHPAVLRVAAIHKADTEHGFSSGFFEEIERTAASMEVEEPEQP